MMTFVRELIERFKCERYNFPPTFLKQNAQNSSKLESCVNIDVIYGESLCNFDAFFFFLFAVFPFSCFFFFLGDFFFWEKKNRIVGSFCWREWFEDPICTRNVSR